METALVCLSLVCLCQSVLLGVCLFSLPFLCWKMRRLEEELEKVDEVQTELAEILGARADGTLSPEVLRTQMNSKPLPGR